MRLILRIAVDVPDSIMGIDAEEIETFHQSVLWNPNENEGLYLHSNYIGETVGQVQVLAIECGEAGK